MHNQYPSFGDIQSGQQQTLIFIVSFQNPWVIRIAFSSTTWLKPYGESLFWKNEHFASRSLSKVDQQKKTTVSANDRKSSYEKNHDKQNLEKSVWTDFRAVIKYHW